jgi:hypothetical protein
MCRTCGGVEERFFGPGYMAWTCARCRRASVRMTDWRVWQRFRLVFERGVLDGPGHPHRPRKVYVLKRE